MSQFQKADQSEDYVIGAIVNSSQAFWVAAGTGIEAEHFCDQELADIFQLVHDTAKKSRDWDSLSLYASAPAELKKTILHLAANAFGGHSIVSNCMAVISAAKARKVRAAGLRIAAIDEIGDEALSQAHAELNAIAGAEAGEVETMGDIMRTVFTGINQRYEQGQTIFGLETLFAGLDEKLGGLSPGLTIVGARPSMGKTAFALQLTSNVALNANASGPGAAKRRVLLVSLEMDSEPLGRRLLAQIGGVNAGRLKKPKELTEQDWPKLTNGVSQLKSAPINVWHKPGASAEQIAGQIRRIAAGGQLALAVVDYLQLIRIQHGKDTLFAKAVGEVCRTLRKVSIETGVPVVLLSQLNRASEGRPQLKDLRDSGEIEQDADTVVFLHRASYYRSGGASSSGIANLIIAKQRDGETGDVDQFWDAPMQRFVDPTPAHYAAEQQEEAPPVKTKYQLTMRGKK